MTEQDAKSRYKSLALKHHPDRPNGSTKIMQEINKEWDMLQVLFKEDKKHTKTAEDFGFKSKYDGSHGYTKYDWNFYRNDNANGSQYNTKNKKRNEWGEWEEVYNKKKKTTTKYYNHTSFITLETMKEIIKDVKENTYDDDYDNLQIFISKKYYTIQSTIIIKIIGDEKLIKDFIELLSYYISNNNSSNINEMEI